MEVRARELVGYCQRRERVSELVKHIQDKRPEKYQKYALELESKDAAQTQLVDGILAAESKVAGILKSAEQTVDIYSKFETGLNELLSHLKPTQLEYTDALVYAQRLLENLAQARRFGETGSGKAERAAVIDQLNRLSLSMLDVSFLELCGLVRTKRN
jgi:hypothetical protein